MRLAIIYLTLVVIVGVIVGAVGLGVGLTKPPASGPVQLSKAERVVFVDLDKIVALHPDWPALLMMRSVAADVAGGQAGSAEPLVLGSVALPALKARAATSRWVLEDRAARQADDALTKLGAEQMQSLAARLQATKKTMIDSAESDLWLRAYDAEQEAAGKIGAISSKYSREQINLRAKIGALDAMLGKRGNKDVGVTPGVNEADARKRLAELQSQLDGIDGEIASEIQKVSDSAARTISDLRASSNAKIDSAIAAYGAQEARTVQEHIKEARSQVIGDVMSLDEIAGSDTGISAKPSVDREDSPRMAGPGLGPKPAYNGRREADDWRVRELALEKRLRADAVSMVRKMAREQGMKVVFDRPAASVPDETARFIRLINDRGWRLGEPILYGPSDS